MRSYSLEGLDLAHAVRSAVLQQTQKGPSLPSLVSGLAELCEREALLAVHLSWKDTQGTDYRARGKVDLEGELQSLLVACLLSDPLGFPQTTCSCTKYVVRVKDASTGREFCSGCGRATWGLAACHHSPLGGNRSAREGASLRRQGARAGWPDLDLRVIDLRGVRRSVLLELKAPAGRASKEQVATAKSLTAAGFEAKVLTGLQEMVDAVARVLRGEPL